MKNFSDISGALRGSLIGTFVKRSELLETDIVILDCVLETSNFPDKDGNEKDAAIFQFAYTDDYVRDGADECDKFLFSAESATMVSAAKKILKAKDDILPFRTALREDTQSKWAQKVHAQFSQWPVVFADVEPELTTVKEPIQPTTPPASPKPRGTR